VGFGFSTPPTIEARAFDSRDARESVELTSASADEKDQDAKN
jgi:hypothetical protein